MSDNDKKASKSSQSIISTSGHERHCFVVMPFGKNPNENRWYKGWYEVVIQPSIAKAGYDPILSSSEEYPVAINDDIRTHLSLDPMVLVDLGGYHPEDDPNPNVMYELGIRHALSLPLVIMAWKSQKIPFDVSNQRTIMESRDMVDIETNRRKIVSFISSAAGGHFYKPMDAVARHAMLETASASLSKDSILGALVKEIRELKSNVLSRKAIMNRNDWGEHKIRNLIKRRADRSELYNLFVAEGARSNAWAIFLNKTFDDDQYREAKKWDSLKWKEFICSEAKACDEQLSRYSVVINEDLIERVKNTLPPQPWSHGIHKDVALKLGIANHISYTAVSELIRRRIFRPQIDGQIVDDEETEKNAT